MENIALRAAAAADEAFLKELFFDVRSAEFAPAGMTREQLAPLLAMQYEAMRRSYAAQYPAAEERVVELGGAPVGRLLTARDGDAVHLIDVSILSGFRGRGIGGRLIEALKADAARVTLSVYAANAGARRLYERHGFRLVGGEEAGALYLAMEWKKDG